MLVETAGHRCQLPDQAGQHLAYIEYLESAPWNRKVIQDPPQYRGVGSALLAAAIKLSLDEGFKGRFGLHSLPQAAAWYTHIGLTDMGPDANARSMHYFEATAEQARRFAGGLFSGGSRG